MKRHILILAACACACAFAGVMSARLGALGRNATVVTNVTDVTPGNYETVSNRAMFAVTTNAQGVAGTVAGMSFSMYPDISPDNIRLYASDLDEFTIDINGADSQYRFRGLFFSDTDNDVMRRADVAGKQDALPYPTNAIPYAAISGAPSGGGTPEWREQWGSVSIQDSVIFITNGIFVLDFDGATQSDTVTAGTNDWPNGAAMFVRGVNVAGPYQVDPVLRIVGYGTWPTNNFQSVWWRSGANIYVNVILEE